MDKGKVKVVLFANTDWYLFNFRLSLAEKLRESGYDVLMISPPGDYGERLRSLGYCWQPLPMNRRSLNPLSELRLLFCHGLLHLMGHDHQTASARADMTARQAAYLDIPIAAAWIADPTPAGG